MQVIAVRVTGCRHPGYSSATVFDRPSKHLGKTSLFDTAVTRLFEMSQCTGNKISQSGLVDVSIVAVENKGSDTWHSGYGMSNPGARSGVPRESCKSEMV